MKIQHSKYLLLLFPAVVFLFFYFYLNFDGLYGQDAYEYVRYTKELRNFIILGENPGDYFWPLFYPIFGALFSFITQKVSLALLLISVCSLSISAIYIHKILALLYPNLKQKALYIFVFFLLSPTVFKCGILVMSDMLTVCFIILSVYQFLKYKKLKLTKNLYFLAIFSVSAFMTRYVSAIVLLPFVIYAVWLFFKQKWHFKHIGFLILLISILLLPHYLVRINNPTEFLSHPWLQDWSFANFFKRNFNTIDGSSYNKLPNILFSFSNLFHPRFLFVGVVFIPFLLWRKIDFKHAKIMIISIVFYAIFLAGIPFQNSRFLVLSFPLIIILCYPIFCYLSELIWIKKIFYLGIIGSIILQFFFIKIAFSSILERNKFEIEITKTLKEYQNNNLYSFDVDIALQGRGLDFNYYNLWYKRYENLKENDLILFHPTKFKKQWQGKNPMLNFNYFKDNYTLKVIKELPEGWKLYKVVE